MLYASLTLLGISTFTNQNSRSCETEPTNFNRSPEPNQLDFEGGHARRNAADQGLESTASQSAGIRHCVPSGRTARVLVRALSLNGEKWPVG